VALKRAIDITGACVGLVLLTPLLLLLALLIKLDSSGPVFYRGLRAGWHGQPFRIFKFRTMVPDAERLGGGSTAKNDPRVTRIGRLLRRYKLDELPQLLNVIRGDMSLVGPRPELPQYAALYAGDEKLILTVRPGITDNASIEFIHLGNLLGDEDADLIYETQIRPRKNALRVQYVKTQSIAGDLHLIWRTLVRLVRG
jgi:lipopolysaccharide/colanic/teichoic acid biosynthesis glycosyltransferase